MKTLTSFDHALGQILLCASSFGVEEVRISQAGGRVLAQPLVAPFHMPRFDNSAVDGYAICESDRALLDANESLQLRSGAVVPAGLAPIAEAVSPGQAARVFTGSRLPDGTAAVIMQEDVAVSESDILLTGSAPPGSNIRRRGAECQKGDLLLEKSTMLTPGAVALAAGVGCDGLVVMRAPRVGMLSTGNELTHPGKPLAESSIYESNSYGVYAALREFPGTQFQRRTVRDDLDSTANALRELLEECDIVLTSGGASVGDYDFIRRAWDQLQIEMVFHGVAIKPGKPFAFGRSGQKPVFALPGNPLSSIVCYSVFVAPFIRASVGLDPRITADSAVLRETLYKKAGRMEFVPAVLREGMVTPCRSRASNMMSGFAQANTLIRFPADAEELKEGSLVQIQAL